jgi:hypothetical protein
VVEAVIAVVDNLPVAHLEPLDEAVVHNIIRYEFLEDIGN